MPITAAAQKAANPLKVGMLTIVAVIAAGTLAGVLFGFNMPKTSFAQAIIVTAPPPPPPPPPIVTPTPAPVTPPPATTPPPSSTGSSGGDDNSRPIIVNGDSNNPTPPPSTTTTPPPPTDTLPPCCSLSTPPTPPPIDTLPPCCTVVTPPPVPPIDILPPCCTVITPPVLPPPVLPPPVLPPPVLPPPVLPPPVSPPPVTPPPSASCISLTASATSISSGQAVTLTWKVNNSKPVTITDETHHTTITTSNDQNGTVVVHPTSQTTYHASVPADLNNPHCTVTVQIVTPPPASSCIALTADKNIITAGEKVTLTWKVNNSKPVTITDETHHTTITTSNDQNGTVVVHPTSQTTYHASVPSDTNNPHCTATVKIVTPVVGSCVYLNASAQNINKGDTVTLSWKVDHAHPVTITDNHGNTITTTNDQSGTVQVTPNEDTTYYASVPSDQHNPNCQASVNINTPGGGGGGGGGGSSHHHGGSSSHVYFNSSTRQAPPLGSVYLSQIPYTGLDLGPVGTVLYWAMLVIWSLAATYLILFGLLPFLKRKLAAFGAEVGLALNNSQPLLPAYAAGAGTAHVLSEEASVPAARPSAYQETAAAVAAQVMERSAPAPVAAPRNASPRVEMTGEGFKKFATGGALTIDDIVKGLSRESGMEISTEPSPEQHSTDAYAPVDKVPAPAAIERELPPAAPVRAAAPKAEQPAAETHPDIIAFIENILEGEKDAVFATIRRLTQAGHDAEAFVSHAILALDDAYKARIDGTPVHEDVKAVTDHCATPFLEKLVSALTTAVDGSYSMGVTGIKLALTRALAVAQG